MDKKQIQQTVIVLPLFLVAGIYCHHKYLLSPLNEKAKTVETELENIKREYQEAEGRAARLPRLEQEIAILNQEISELQQKLPNNKDVPNLIRLLSRKMERHNITWSKIEPGSQTAKDYYIEHSYSIPFTTSYHDLSLFLSEIGQMERIFASKFSRLQAVQNAKSGETFLSGELIFLIYTSKG